jgi:hypothetical protein
MKKCILLLIGLVAATVAQAAENRVFVLATAGDVDSALVEGMRAHMEENSGAAVRLASPIPMEPGQSLEAIGHAAAKTLGENDHSIIVLARPTDDQPQGICLPQFHFAVLNVAKLEVGADTAHLARRAGQEGLHAMAFLLGMTPCPFPLCVLVGYEKTSDLDEMSGNYCPPCLDRFTRLAREAGIQLIEAAPATEPAAAPAAEPVAEPVAAPVLAPSEVDPAAVPVVVAPAPAE